MESTKHEVKAGNQIKMEKPLGWEREMHADTEKAVIALNDIAIHLLTNTDPEKAAIALNEIVKIAIPIFWTVGDVINLYFQEKYGHDLLFDGNMACTEAILHIHSYERKFRDETENPE